MSRDMWLVEPLQVVPTYNAYILGTSVERVRYLDVP